MAEILIYGTIGDGFDGITAKAFAEQLRDAGNDPVTIRINSPGGDAYAGIAAANLISQHGNVTAIIDGLAASAASIIAAAAREVRAAESAMLMVHRAWGVTVGNSEDMIQMADVLRKLDGQIAGVYARRSGTSAAAWLDRMDAETWMTAEEAEALGLVDVVDHSTKASNRLKHDLSRFKNVPRTALERYGAEVGARLAELDEDDRKAKRWATSSPAVAARLDEISRHEQVLAATAR